MGGFYVVSDHLRIGTSEAKRVLKSGGILANRELICDSSFLEPSSEGLAGGWDTFANLLAANGGHPQMGKELKRLSVG